MEYSDNLVSIITPVYNAQRFLRAAADSVLNQTYKSWEMLLVDDCSSDESPGIAKEYAGRDARFRYIKLEKNSGAAAARNRGIDEARGRYLAFLDADDLWLPGKLEAQLSLMKSRKAGFSFTAIEMIGEDGNTVRPKRPVREVVDYRFLLSNTMIACSSVVVDRAVTGEFHMPLIRKGQDYATWLYLLRGGMKAYGINEALVRYRLVQGSVSSNKFGALKRTWNIYRRQEHLSVFRSAWHFGFYTLHAVKKYFF